MADQELRQQRGGGHLLIDYVWFLRIIEHT